MSQLTHSTTYLHIKGHDHNMQSYIVVSNFISFQHPANILSYDVQSSQAFLEPYRVKTGPYYYSFLQRNIYLYCCGYANPILNVDSGIFCNCPARIVTRASGDFYWIQDLSRSFHYHLSVTSIAALCVCDVVLQRNNRPYPLEIGSISSFRVSMIVTIL